MDRSGPRWHDFVVWMCLLIVAVSGFMFVAAYYFKFGPISNGALSTSTTVWSEFGEYIGGTVGTVFAAGAFLLALLTLKSQRDMVKWVEIGRLLASLTHTLDKILRSPAPLLNIPSVGIRHELRYLEVALNNAVYWKLADPEDWEEKRLSREQLIKAALDPIRLEIIEVVARLKDLEVVLKLFDKGWGADTTVRFYKQRYGLTVGVLSELNFIPPDDAIINYFNGRQRLEAFQSTFSSFKGNQNSNSQSGRG